MDDMDLSDGPPEGLFFAGSDDDGENMTAMEAVETPATSSTGSSPPGGLFLPDSDDDELVQDVVDTPPKPKRRLPSSQEDEPDGDIQVLAAPDLKSANPPQRASSVQSVGRVSVMAAPSPATRSVSPTPLPKKRRISPKVGTPPTFTPTYLGEILVPNAWSNVSGKGYVKPNEPIQIKRDERNETKQGPSRSSSAQGKKKGDNKKQLSLTAMLKSQPAKSSKKKKTDNIVRLFNSRGFGRFKFIQLVNTSVNIHLKNSVVSQQMYPGGYQNF